MPREPGHRIGVGGSADVFEYGDGAVLKLFRAEYTFAVAMEAERTRAVHDAGVASPDVIDVVSIGERRGIVLERIEGSTLLDDLIAGRRDPRLVGALTAEVQIDVHAVHADLPRLADVANLANLVDGTVVAHLDLHPGNVMFSPSGPIVIDWVNAHLCAAAADVARSVMTIRYQGLGLRAARGGLDEERAIRQEVLDGYLERYRAPAGSPAGLDGWLTRTAARLLHAEPHNPDREQLRHIVDDNAV